METSVKPALPIADAVIARFTTPGAATVVALRIHEPDAVVQQVGATMISGEHCLDDSRTDTRTGSADTDPVRAAGGPRVCASDGLFRLRELGHYCGAESR